MEVGRSGQFCEHCDTGVIAAALGGVMDVRYGGAMCRFPPTEMTPTVRCAPSLYRPTHVSSACRTCLLFTAGPARAPPDVIRPTPTRPPPRPVGQQRVRVPCVWPGARTPALLRAGSYPRISDPLPSVSPSRLSRAERRRRCRRGRRGRCCCCRCCCCRCCCRRVSPVESPPPHHPSPALLLTVLSPPGPA